MRFIISDLAIVRLAAVVEQPWSGQYINYQAVILGPFDGSTVLSTVFYNDAIAQTDGGGSYVFYDEGDHQRVDAIGQYYAESISIGLGQVRQDYAINAPDAVDGYAEVDLTYVGTGLVAGGPGTILEGQVFDLTVSPQGNTLVDPIQYEWFRDGESLGDPTTLRTFRTFITGSGMTVEFEVHGTDANGQLAMSKTWVTVPANCGNPPCPPQ
jgi:hypothetical protein